VPVSNPAPASYPVNNGGLPPEVKQQKNEAGLTPVSSLDVNVWSFTSCSL
jgi:hypothetical protein